MKNEAIKDTMNSIENRIRHVYNQGFADGIEFSDEAHACTGDYERGLNDAWECAKKIMLSDEDGGIALSDILKIFGMTQYSAIKRFSASEAIAKIKEYEEKQKKDYCECCRYWDEESKRGCKSPCIEKIEYEEKHCHEHKYALLIGKFTRALNEFADRLEQIEKKYADKSESEEAKE